MPAAGRANQNTSSSSDIQTSQLGEIPAQTMIANASSEPSRPAPMPFNALPLEGAAAAAVQSILTRLNAAEQAVARQGAQLQDLLGSANASSVRPEYRIDLPTITATANAVGGVATAAPPFVTGTTPITHAYQWQRLISAVWTNIAGATSASFTFANAGLHRCMLTPSNVAGSGTPTPTPEVDVIAVAPPPPTYSAVDLVATELSPGQVNLTWPAGWPVAVVGRNGVDTSGFGAFSGPPTALPFQQLVPGTTYTLYVQMANGGPTVNKSFTTAAAAPAPAPSTSVVAGVPAAPAVRDAFKEPFLASSPWNMPRGRDAVLLSMPLRLPTIGNTQNWTDFTDDKCRLFGPTGPSRIVRTAGDWPARAYASPSQPLHRFSPINIPDGVILLLNQENQFWVAIDANGNVKSDQPLYRENGTSELQSGFTRQGRPIPLYNVVSGDGIEGCQGGSGLSAIGACLRVGEMRPGAVGSGGVPGLAGTPKFGALGLTWPFGINGTFASNLQAYHPTTNPRGSFRWPASKSDGYALAGVRTDGGFSGYGRLADPDFPTGVCPGVLLAIDIAVTPESLGLETAVGRLFLWTLQRYGCYLKDDSGNDYRTKARTDSEGWGLGGYKWIAQSRGDNELTNPALDFSAQFQADWGIPFRGRRAFMSGTSVNVQGTTSGNNPWVRDQIRLIGALKFVADNAADNVGGAGPRLWWIKNPATFTP